jgi:hypothetical protein
VGEEPRWQRNSLDCAADFRIPMGSKAEFDYETKWKKRPSLLTAIDLGD